MLREPIPACEPTGQSFVADWTNFSKTGGGDEEDAAVAMEANTQAVTESIANGDVAQDTDLEESASEWETETLDTEEEGVAPVPDPPADEVPDQVGGDGFLQRMFRRQPTGEIAAASPDEELQTEPPLQRPPPPQVEDTGLGQQTTRSPDLTAARELVSALQSATTTSSGTSITEVMEQIATSLRAIEVSVRTLTRSLPANPTNQPPPRDNNRDNRDRDNRENREDKDNNRGNRDDREAWGVRENRNA